MKKMDTKQKYSFIIVLIYTWIVKSDASVNLAQGKAAKQSSILDGHGPNLAVDGIELNSGQFGSRYCTQTLGSYRQVWWQVDLGQRSQIKTIQIIYRKNFEKSLEYVSIYFSEDANWWNGKLCHKNNPNTYRLPTSFELNCATAGRYVTIYNDRNATADAYLDLCEVKVMGCPEGKHGHGNCLSDCQPHNCKTCDPDSGVCSGCKDGTFGLNCNLNCQIRNCKSCERFNGTTCTVCQDGFTGNICQQCATGRYGRNCAFKCPAYCLNGKCNDIGLCSQGCVAGFNGSTCEDCIDGKYGLYCQSNCQLANCKSCERYTGTCTKCKDNYTGPKCQECIVGKYGYYCNMGCPSNCRDTCDKSTGNCNNGCKDGWSGRRCEECATGRYGILCSKECSKNCFGQRCERPTGKCSSGCKTGWTGSQCQGCADGYFGTTCNQRCYCKYGSCDRYTGICMMSGECKPGYMGPSCNISCPSGTFGSGCKSQCHCKFGTCDQSGRCAFGCKAGYIGQTCSDVCADYSYGLNCASKCHCVGGPCEKNAGSCPMGGCREGYHGQTCSEECNLGTFGTNCAERCHCRTGYCNRINGNCYQPGCASGYQGISCNQKCNYGSYGLGCLEKCFCKNGTCDHITGRCPTRECQNGFLGLNCNVPCRDGFFGPNCNMSCFCARGPCNKSTGQCPPGGCTLGWQGSTCNQRCSDGYFGDGCRKRCFCKSGPCDSFSGKCIHGECMDGYMGTTCSNVCVSGTFGPNCSMACHCKHKSCLHDTGLCQSSECEDGWIGSSCNKECSFGRYGPNCLSSCQNCKNQNCSHINGTCFNGCQDGWTGNICDMRSLAVQSAKGQTDKMIPIFAGCIVGVILVISVIVLLIFIVRRKHKKRKPVLVSETMAINGSNENLTEQREMNVQEHVCINAAFSEDGETDKSLDTTYQNTNDYYNMAGRDTNISELGNLIRNKMDNDAFQDEYSKLPSGLVHPHTVSLKPDNKAKNRFISVYSYDHSRVILEKIQNDDHSDYINANYIDAVDKYKGYIATQGPRKNTVFDFWRMVWECQCNRIVMLTGLVENGKVKCERYWPSDDTPLTLSYLCIEIKDSQKTRFYTKRLFRLTNKNTEESHFVHQYHFTTWPDHGTPDPLELVLFHRCFSEDTELTGPVVVHCSAGIGRTGTFIALDALYQYGMKTEAVDIFEYVKTMRKDRMNMIQTLDQYIFLHEVLLEAFNYMDTTIKTENFLQALQHTQEGPKNQNRIRKEFQALESNRPVHSNNCYKSSLNGSNINKNKGHIYAHDKFRTFLISFSPERNNYINAVSLPSQNKQNAYIATHFPLQTTLVDFWCLLYDHSDDVIIFDYKQEEMAWFPIDKTSIQVDGFTVTRVTAETSDTSSVTVVDILLKHKNSKEKPVKVYLVPESISSSLNTKSYIQLSEMVNYSKTSRPITLVCPDGALYCGIFCTIHSTIQRIQHDNEVDLYHTVRKLQTRRPEFITTLEQYQLCYEVIKEYFNTEAVYVNS